MISTNQLTSAKDRSTKWLERGLFATLVLACLLAMSHHKADPDFWGHVQYGRDALQDGLPATTTYSYTTEGYRWINHENLSELLMAVSVDRLGPASLLVFKSLMALMLMVLIYRQAQRDGISSVPIYVTMLLVACNLMHSWTLRPQLLTYSLFTIMIALLGWCFAGWPNPWAELVRRDGGNDSADATPQPRRLRWLWLLVPLFVIWTNSHGGFVAGYCILAAYLAGRSLELLIAQRRGAWPTIGLITTVLAVTGLATLINPYGIELHQWLLQSLGARRPEILEWLPPELFSVVWPAWWLLVVIFVVSLIFTRRPRDLTQVMILCLTLWQACEHRRHIAFFAILFGFWMPIHVDSLLARIRGKARAESEAAAISPRFRWAMLTILPVAILGLGVGLFCHLRQIPVRRDAYPVSAFQYITDQDLSGNLVLRFKWAQYAIAAFGVKSDERPHLRVAFDGRFRTCYPQELVDMYFDFAIGDAPPEMRHRSPDSGPVDGSRILAYGEPDLVLIDRAQTYSVQIMEQQGDNWVLLYQDELAQLWGRADKYDNPFAAEFVKPEDRLVTDAPQSGSVAWPALPRREQHGTQLAQAAAP